MEKVAALVLTAGASRRMGTPKALLPWGQTTVIQHLLDQIRQAGFTETLLVTGAHHDVIQKALAVEGVEISLHPSWELGMGSTISRGVQEVEERFSDIDAILILLVDQPRITHGYLRRVLEAHQSQPDVIIASDYGDFAGAPALFPRNFWEGLKRIPPTQGARKLIASYRDKCVILDPGGAIVDIDTPEAYKKALSVYLSNQTKNVNE
ncbi:MAG: nucleotidyltransferase family protein [Robiginitalea sp.]|uniref:nucleotidyltransferase family protein n=1 Tax=Robiginitalea sp. TaxID=1902411 RepID=UPI003C755D33